MATATPVRPNTFEQIVALWHENPDITYGEMAQRLSMSVFDVMAVIDANVGDDLTDAA